MALKARGVSEVYVVDIMDKRLEKAMELGTGSNYATLTEQKKM